MADFFNTIKNFFAEVFEGALSAKETEGTQDSSVFYTHYIAGECPHQIDEAFARRLARAYINMQAPTKVAIGRDSRNSSGSLATTLARTFLESGVDVVELGLTTTPFVAWITREKKVDAIMVTCARSSATHNGFMLYSATTGEALTQETGLKELEEYMRQKETPMVRAEKEGKVLHRNEYKDEYKKLLVQAATGSPRKKKLPKKLRVAVDYSSGTASLVVNDLLRTLGVSFSTVNEQPSGAFPGHGPNPIAERAWENLSHLIQEGRYHCGVLFGAAGERIAFLDEQGRHIPTAQMGSLLVDFYLPRADHWRNVVVSSEVSKTVSEAAEKAGGRAYKAGASYIEMAARMREHRAVLGVTRDGRYFFKDFDYADSAAFTLAKVLRVLAAQERTQASELVEPFDSYVTLPPIRVPYQEGTEDAVVRALKQHFRGETEKENTGLTVRFKTWWFSIRRSHTEPGWVLSLEGEKREQLERKRREIETIVKNAKELTEDKE